MIFKDPQGEIVVGLAAIQYVLAVLWCFRVFSKYTLTLSMP